MRTKLYRTATIIATITLAFLFYNYNNSDNYSYALEYSTNADVSFTINPSITVSLSSSDLLIDELSPGTSSDSNSIVVNVSTNNVNGYHLSSTVGSSSNASTSLVHNTNNSNVFSSLSPDDSLSDLDSFTPGTWGYSYATSSTTDSETNTTTWNWSNYSGLPLYNDTTHTAILSERYTPANDNIGFKIAAYADSVQASGEYNNTINFTATAYPNPMTLSESYAYFNKQQTEGYYTMQDMEPGICATATDLSTMQVIDLRDHNTYTIAKLADHRCWMTTNLDLPGGTALYSDTSNVAEGYPESGGVPYYTLPESSATGFDDDTKAFVYNSGNHADNCTDSQPCYSYYSWIATTAGSGPSTIIDKTAPYSICPLNWRLPDTKLGTNSDTDFRTLITALGGTSEISLYDDTTEPTGQFLRTKITVQPYNIVLGGIYVNSSFESGGKRASYWSSTKYSSITALYLYLPANLTSLDAAKHGNFFAGFSVRCIANNE